ncbi:MAG: MarR family winged helix-turn-helix transcriptional regulator [Xanthobacteraceae bacterium]
MKTQTGAAERPAPEQLLENQLCFAVYAAAHSFAQAYRPFLDPVGLTYPQYLILLELWERDDQTVGELGEPLFLDSGTLTPMLRRMETAGWIRRRRDAVDGRVVRVSLTAKGHGFRRKARAIPAAMMCASNLDLAGLSALRNKLKRVAQALRDDARQSTSGR